MHIVFCFVLVVDVFCSLINSIYDSSKSGHSRIVWKCAYYIDRAFKNSCTSSISLFLQSFMTVNHASSKKILLATLPARLFHGKCVTKAGKHIKMWQTKDANVISTYSVPRNTHMRIFKPKILWNKDFSPTFLAAPPISMKQSVFSLSRGVVAPLPEPHWFQHPWKHCTCHPAYSGVLRAKSLTE